MKACPRIEHCNHHKVWELDERWEGEADGWCTAVNFRLCKNKPKRKSSYLSTKSDEGEGTVKRSLGRGSGRRFGKIGRKKS